jgi:hypothetical protein
MDGLDADWIDADLRGGWCRYISWWQLATRRRLMKVEHRYTLGAALFMVLTSVAYLLLVGR